MKKSKAFGAEISPPILLLDVQGRRNPVLTPERAEFAIALANQMQALGGTGRPAAMSSDDNAHSGSILLYYRSHRGRPTKGEIARAARAIARSEVRRPAAHPADELPTDALYVTGTRAVVYPEILAAGASNVVFLVSKQVWFNQNRSTIGFPRNDEERKLFLEDINARLTEGEVSLPR